MASSTKIKAVINGKETTLDAAEVTINGVRLSDFFASFKALQKEVRELQKGLTAKDEHYKGIIERLGL